MKRKMPWVIVGTISLLYFITYVDRVNISFAAPSITKDLNLSPTQMGHVFSAFSLPYALLQVPGGWLGDKIGGRKALAVMAVLWSAMTMLTAVPFELVGLVLARMGLGLAEGGAFPTASRTMAGFIPAKHRGLAQGLPHTAARLGGAVSPAIVVTLTVLYGWRAMFVILGFASLMWVGLWLAVNRMRPSDAVPTTPEVETVRPSPIAWRPLLRRMWPVTAADFCYGWSLWVFLTWMPTYLASARHMQLQQLALYATLPLAAGAIGDTLGGLSSDLLWRAGHVRLARGGQIGAGLVLSLVFVLPAAFTSSPQLAVWLLAASFLALEMTNSPLWALSMDIGRDHTGLAGGLMNTGYGIAGIISPLVFGALVQLTGNWALPFVVSSVLLLAGAAVTMLIDPVSRVGAEHESFVPEEVAA